MAPHRDIASGENFTKNNSFTKKSSGFSMETLSRTFSEISLELINHETLYSKRSKNDLSPISEVEDAKCEGCGMCEECTPEYVKRREKFTGSMVCGLCSEAVKEEMENNGGKLEEALCAHVYTCARFNRLDRAYPVLCQAEAIRVMLKKNRAKSLSPKDKSSASVLILLHIINRARTINRCFR